MVKIYRSADLVTWNFLGTAFTGHNSEIITDNRNKTWLLYHAVDKTSPKGRVLMLDEVQWKDGWPFVENNTPGTYRIKPSLGI